MKKMISAILVILSIITICSVSAQDSAKLPQTGYTSRNEKYNDDTAYAGYCGRLVLPYTGIDVALYSDYSQAVCDREDSACCFPWEPYDGIIIADHNYQEFSKLPEVYAGEIGEILNADGTVSFIVCVDAFEGYNTGYDITDSYGHSALGQYDITMYTCLDNWENVSVCQWQILDSHDAVSRFLSMGFAA